jgi:hypothetical protein
MATKEARLSDGTQRSRWPAMAWVLVGSCAVVVLWAIATRRTAYSGAIHDCLRAGRVGLPRCRSEAQLDGNFAALVAAVIGTFGVVGVAGVCAIATRSRAPSGSSG